MHYHWTNFYNYIFEGRDIKARGQKVTFEKRFYKSFI